MPNNTTLLDLAKLNGADPVVGLIEEVATASPEVVTIPARTIRGTSYKTVIRNSRPSVAFRSANEGTAGSKSNFAERLVEAFILSARIEVDKAVARGYEDGPEALQAIEGAGVMRAALSTVGSQTIYGRNAGSKGFIGLQEFITTFGDELVVDAGGTTSGTGSSVYAIKAGNQGVQYVYGNGTSFELSPFREGDAADASGNRFAAYIADLTAWVGLQCVNRYAIGRIKKCTADSGKGVTDAKIAELLQVPRGRAPNASSHGAARLKLERRTAAHEKMRWALAHGELAEKFSDLSISHALAGVGGAFLDASDCIAVHALKANPSGKISDVSGKAVAGCVCCVTFAERAKLKASAVTIDILNALVASLDGVNR